MLKKFHDLEEGDRPRASPARQHLMVVEDAAVSGSTSMHLTDEQRRIVEWDEGPAIVIAGPGTGKTQVIVERVRHLLATHPDLRPEQILVLTDDAKAAGRLEERLDDAVGIAVRARMTVTDLHGLCERILTESAADAGLPPNPDMLDGVGQLLLLGDLRPRLQLLSHSNRPFEDFVGFINRAKAERVTPGDFIAFVVDEYLAFEARYGSYEAATARIEAQGPEGLSDSADDAALQVMRLTELAHVYREYEIELARRGALDDADQIAAVIRLFKTCPDVLRRWQRQFRYLLVDDIQDASAAQVELIELLGRTPDRPDNVMVVGDDDQSIDRFRGAGFAPFAEFETRFTRPPPHDLDGRAPGPPPRLRLERNFRSTRNVLTVADRLIAGNEIRFEPDKRLVTKRDDGEPVRIVVCAGPEDEAFAIVGAIQAWRSPREGIGPPLSSFAILCRNRGKCDAIAARLRAQGIPYTVVGGGGELPTSVLSEDVEGVQVMTVDQAKGLEFPIVFVPGLLEGEWPAKEGHAGLFPRELRRETVPPGDIHIEHERRLLYVAMTRAQERLVLTTHAGPTAQQGPSRFLGEIVWGGAGEVQFDDRTGAVGLTGSPVLANSLVSAVGAGAGVGDASTVRTLWGELGWQLGMADALWDLLRLVVIGLERGDDAQSTFETLKARGTPLLAADLVKNYLFRRMAAVEGPHAAERAYVQHWSRFDGPDWREEIEKGPIRRARIDVLLSHWLATRRNEAVDSRTMVASFIRYANPENPKAILVDLEATAAMQSDRFGADRA